MYIRNVLIGLGLSVLFTASLVLLDVAHLRHLTLETSGGWLAIVMLVVFNTICFAGAQFGIAVPLITVIALSFGSLLEGSVLTEIIFSWPGIGSYITKTLLAGDMNAVLGGTIVVGTCFVALNLLSDILYRVLDPRAG